LGSPADRGCRNRAAPDAIPPAVSVVMDRGPHPGGDRLELPGIPPESVLRHRRVQARADAPAWPWRWRLDSRPASGSKHLL